MEESRMLAEFRGKFQVDELLIAATPAWSWSLRPGQATLGAGVLSLNRYAARLSDVSAAEMSELAELVGILERSVEAAFDYQIVNYLMLMMVDHHVHYHVIPRYQGCRKFAGLVWDDAGWPGFPTLGESQHKDQQGVLTEIRDALRRAAGASGL